MYEAVGLLPQQGLLRMCVIVQCVVWAPGCLFCSPVVVFHGDECVRFR